MKVRELSSLLWRNIIHARSKNAWLVGIIALATALITGALMLGSSVRQSLRDAATARTGEVEWALMPQNQWFSDDLNTRTRGESNALIQQQAFCYNAEGVAVNIMLYGVDDAFFRFAYGIEQPLTTALASPETLRELGLKSGENIVLRLPQKAHYAEGLSWSLGEQEMMGLRLPLHETEQGMGFQLSSGMQEGRSIFVPKSTLQQKLGKEEGGNTLLLKKTGAGAGDALLTQAPSLKDYGLELKQLDTGQWELCSTQTFIPEAVGIALAQVSAPQQGIFTYFVNELRLGDKRTPYSFITGMTQPIGGELVGEECRITQWLADDLGAKVGDCIDISYFEIQARGSLSSAAGQLRVKDIIPTADRRGLTPPFPGFTDSESCNDWDPSIPVDIDSIREEDEAYWNDYQGSPKLFISLEKAQQLFGSVSGQHSAIRFEHADGAQLQGELEAALAQHITLFQALPLQDINQQGTEQSMDFSGLFLALSFFVIVAAVILLVLVSMLRMGAKRYEMALLQSLGYTGRGVLLLLMGEFGFFILLGTALGCLLALAYVAGILALLNSIWNSISGYATISFATGWQQIAMGAGISAGISLLSIYLVAKRSLHETLRQQLKHDYSRSIWTRSDQAQTLLWAGMSLGCYLLNALSKDNADIALFFVGSFLLLMLAFKGTKYGLYRLSRAPFERMGFMGLALRNLTRNITRSMAVLSMLSLGMFICLLTILNHRSMEDDANPHAGTGGYYGILETAVPIRHDLNSEAGRREYKLPEGIRFHQLQRVEGAQAGCLNLNRVVRPQLIAAPQAALAGRFSFSDDAASWEMLESEPILDKGTGIPTIPVMADAEVIQWSLGLKIGDELDYTAEGGAKYRLKFVAGLNKSIFQGYVIVSQDNLARLYPTQSQSGSDIMLIDFAARPQLSTISKALERQGVFFTTAAQRLRLFNDVQNTYLMIFFILGTIGLMLATLGFTLLTQHQLIERQGELKLLHSIGHSPSQISRLILTENGILLALAILATLLALAAAIIPLSAQHLITPPYGLMMLSIVLITITALGLLHALAKRSCS